MSRPYTIVLDSSQCSSCRKEVRKTYLPHNSVYSLCSSCVNKVLNVRISSEELSVPSWLLALSERYVEQRLYEYQHEGRPSEGYLDFVAGFFSNQYGVYRDSNTSVPLSQHIAENDSRYVMSVQGKRIKPYWKVAVQEHLVTWHQRINLDMTKPIREFLVCPDCNKHLYDTGLTRSNEEGNYRGYVCLSAREACPSSRKKAMFAHYGANKIKRTERPAWMR